MPHSREVILCLYHPVSTIFRSLCGANTAPQWPCWIGGIDHDPDTCVVMLDPGWGSYPCHAIRLDNFSSPDGDPVEQKLMAFCAVRFPPGTPVRVRSKKLPRSFNQPMTFTRYAASMECVEGNIGLMLQAELDRLREIGAI